jgi:hypothetical protein
MQANIRDPRTHAIIGAAMEVHKNMGSGLLEAVKTWMNCGQYQI